MCWKFVSFYSLSLLLGGRTNTGCRDLTLVDPLLLAAKTRFFQSNPRLNLSPCDWQCSYMCRSVLPAFPFPFSPPLTPSSSIIASAVTNSSIQHLCFFSIVAMPPLPTHPLPPPLPLRLPSSAVTSTGHESRPLFHRDSSVPVTACRPPTATASEIRLFCVQPCTKPTNRTIIRAASLPGARQSDTLCPAAARLK